MADSLSVNARKAWTVNVPTPSVVASNLYQYDLFPTGTSRAVMYPQDSLGVMNDSMLYNFDCDASNLLNGSASLFNQVMPLLQKWQAQQAALYQKMMMAISGGTNTNINVTDTTNITNNDGKKQIDGKKVISETEVSTTLQNKIMSDPTWSKIFTSNDFEYTDKDGKKQTTSLLRRLIGLCDDYMKNLKDPELSTENYEKIWDIAGRYAKTGKLSREDYATLVQIAQNPGGPGAYKADENDDDDTDVKSKARSNANIIERANASNGYKKTAENYFEAMDGPGTDKKLMAKASKAVTKDNVIETIQAFNEHNEMEGDGLTLVEKIFDECNNWGTGNNHGWLTTNGWGDDDAKPYVKKIKEALVERAEEFVEDKACSEETAKAIKDAITNLETRFNAVTKGDLNKNDKESVSEAVNKLYETLLKAEKETYKEFDKEYNITDEQVLSGQE